MADADMNSDWAKNPESGKLATFVFLIVDVIDSSELFAEVMDDESLLDHADALDEVYSHVRKCLGLEVESEWEWNWAGDGGVFAFPTMRPHTASDVFESAKQIAELPPHVAKSGERRQLRLRLVLHRGEAYLHPHKGLRRSAALNNAAKLRVPGQRTSITVTEEIRSRLKVDDQHRDVLRPTRLGTEYRQLVYAYFPLVRIALQDEIDEADAQYRIAQAAHLSYRLGTLNLSVGARDRAIHAFDRAMNFIEQIKPKHRFFHRTLHEFYRMWRMVATDADPELLKESDGYDWQKMMRSDRWKEFIKSHPPEGAWQLLLQVEVIMEQLQLLVRQPVKNPVGLTSLELCLLLERFGYPRKWYGTALFDRIDRIKLEMKENRGQSIDDDCSICTGVAASCLLLDRQREATDLLAWLHERKSTNFCFRGQDTFVDAEPHEHALHYTAAALQAFVDNGTSSDVYIEHALDVFFNGAKEREHGFPIDWMRNRSTSLYDFCSHVFPAFTRYLLAGRELDKEQKNVLFQTLQALASHIKDDAHTARLNGPEHGRVYGARENIGSFALGCLLGMPSEVTPILDYNLERLFRYATRPRTEAQRQRTIDSSIDRARKMIEGWLLQFECALYLREKELAIPAGVTQWLGVGPERPEAEARPQTR